MQDATELQREVDRVNLQRELTRLCWQKWRYPKSLYHADGRYRVVFSGEEHAALKIEGWADEESPGKEYRLHTAVASELATAPSGALESELRDVDAGDAHAKNATALV